MFQERASNRQTVTLVRTGFKNLKRQKGSSWSKRKILLEMFDVSIKFKYVLGKHELCHSNCQQMDIRQV